MFVSYNVRVSEEAVLGNAVEKHDKKSETCITGFKRLNTNMESLPFFSSVNPFLSIRVMQLQLD